MAIPTFHDEWGPSSGGLGHGDSAPFDPNDHYITSGLGDITQLTASDHFTAGDQYITGGHSDVTPLSPSDRYITSSGSARSHSYEVAESLTVLMPTVIADMRPTASPPQQKDNSSTNSATMTILGAPSYNYVLDGNVQNENANGFSDLHSGYSGWEGEREHGDDGSHTSDRSPPMQGYALAQGSAAGGSSTLPIHVPGRQGCHTFCQTKF